MQQLAVQGQEAHLTAGQTGQDRVQVPVQETAPAQEQNCREFLIVPEQGEADNRAGSNTNTGSRRRNPQSTRRSYGGSSQSGRTRRRKHRPSPVEMVLKFLIPLLVVVILIVAIRTLMPGKKKADPTQPETVTTEQIQTEPEAPTPEETQPPADTYVVTGNKVNVRTEPSANGRILVQLEGGTEVVYVKRYNNDWTVINYDGQEAYISSQYIAKQEAETDAQPQEEAAAESESVTN